MRGNPAYLWGLLTTIVVASLALVVNVHLALAAGFFVILGWWTWHWPHQAVYLLIVLAPLLPMLKITQTMGNFTLIKDIIILALFIKVLLRPLLTKQLSYRRNILFAPILALVIWTAVAALRADSLILGLLRSRDIVLYILLYFVVLYLPRSKQFYREAASWFLISAAIVATLGWYQFFFVADSAVLRFDPARQTWIPRVSSIMAHPSILGQYLIAVSTFLVAHVLASHRWWVLSAGGLGLIAPLVYLTFSRAVWLGYIAGLGGIILSQLWGWLREKKNVHGSWKIWGTGAVGIMSIMALILQFTSVGIFVRSAFDPAYASNAERLDFLVRLISPMTSTHALIGLGLGDVLQQNFRVANITVDDIASGASRSVQLAKDLTLVDNQYLKTFVEMGLAGLLIYLWLYWRVARASWHIITHYSLLITRIIGLWSLGFLAAFVVQAFFIDIWDIFPTNAAFWIIAALVSRELTVACPMLYARGSR